MVYFGNTPLVAFAAFACAAIQASPIDVEQSQNQEEISGVFVFSNCTGKPIGAIGKPLGDSYRLIEPLTDEPTNPDFGKFAVNADGAKW
jgi:hypothetical protein